ncbi:MAG: hypothetical protein JXR59_06350 [Desulfuromonadaceae bacterium]|nr:hypothetical protein [Desulfuromonadaceae bacterium]
MTGERENGRWCDGCVRGGVIALLLLLLLGGCQNQVQDPLRISINPWLGFTPFAYAQQKGWLKPSEVKLLWVVGLEESLKLYRQNLSDGFLATQYEYFALGAPATVKPVLLIDRSCGADVILANRTLAELRAATQLTVYLEPTSVNQDILDAFVRQYGLSEIPRVFSPSDPESMTSLSDCAQPSLLISYEPYATRLGRMGFQRLASTRELNELMVVDALWIGPRAEKYPQTVATLKDVFHRAVAQLQQNPQEYYETVRGYLEGQTFADFERSLSGIEWLAPQSWPPVLSYLNQQQIPTGAIEQ